MLVGRWLFHPVDGKNFRLEDDHLAKMMEITGERFNNDMLKHAEKRDEYFDEDGMPYASCLPLILLTR